MVKRFWRWLVRLIQPILPPCLKRRKYQRVKPAGKREEYEGKSENAETDEAEVWLNRGNQQFSGQNFLSAITSFENATEIQPDNSKAWYNKGNALVKSGKNEKALVSFDKAIELKPDNYEAWQNRCDALVKLGENEKALVSFDKAIKPGVNRISDSTT